MMKNESLNTKICAKQDAKQLNCREQLLGEPFLFRIRDQGPQHGDPISAMRPAVYYPRESVGNPRTNENSPFQIGPDAGESPGLY